MSGITSVRWPALLAALFLAPGLAACGPGKTPLELLSTTGATSTGDGDGDSGDGDGDPTPTPPQQADSPNVDILIVLDNSGSMGGLQTKLVNGIDTLVDALDAADADYRIAVTTSDNGNPWCPPGTTTPESGEFVLRPCTHRINDFIFNSGETDVSDSACYDVCALDDAALDIQPTSTAVDPTPRPRPWVEKIAGETNLPPTTDVADALRCFLPMGINGCGFESQLESMYLGLIRAQNEDEDNYGFVRNDSVLAVLLISDEVDCSYNKTYSEIFEQDGNRVFWSDPSATFPSSAVCWNAGVTCTGDPNNYDSCSSSNKDVDGNEGVSDADAVLHPMSRYHALLSGLELDIQELQPGRQLVVGLLGGVGSNGEPFYADTLDPFQQDFGIGPGCTAPNPFDPSDPIEAVPPVRMHELVNAFSPGNSYSVCNDDFSSALAAFAAQITAQLP